jgi:hypothetical protein
MRSIMHCIFQVDREKADKAAAFLSMHFHPESPDVFSVV